MLHTLLDTLHYYIDIDIDGFQGAVLPCALPCATLGFRLVDMEDIECRVVSCRV